MKLPVDPRALFDSLRDLRSRTRTPPATVDSGRDPIVRRMDFGFTNPELDFPKHWMGGSVLGTAITNGMNLLFPEGERFFVRSVRYYMDELEDPQLRAQVQRFFGQEGQHARSHQQYMEVLTRQGYDLDAFLKPYKRVAFGIIEPAAPKVLCLSITAALEHFTATFAEAALSERFFDELAPPAMAELLLWHAAEEIEHKDVAFEVLRQIDDRYSVRIAGLVAACVLLWAFWTAATLTLLAQEEELDPKRLAQEWLGAARSGRTSGTKMRRAFLSYLEPGFHPANTGNDELALAYLEEIGRRAG